MSKQDKRTSVEAINNVANLASEISDGISIVDLSHSIIKNFPNIKTPDPVKSFVEKLTEQRNNNSEDHQR